MNVEYLLGNAEVTGVPAPPYAEETMAFLSDVSAMLLRDAQAKRYPDIVSYAFWSRKAHLVQMKEETGIREVRLGRGLSFHIAPSNIPVNFVFTCAFGLLAGNSCIVRLPSREFPQTEILCNAYKTVLKKYPQMQNRIAWIRYERDLETSAHYSLMADVRMIWGGDRTVGEMRALPTKPRCMDVFFADRYSLGMIDAGAVLAASDEEIARLAQDFYNDTFLVDQNACSSPQLLLWRYASDAAKERFWAAVDAVAGKKYTLQPAIATDKLLRSCLDAVHLEDATGAIHRQGNLIYRIALRQLPEHLSACRGISGYFYELDLDELEELAPFITEQFQTLCVYGCDAKELQEEIVSHGIRGIDRIVPFGKALDLSVVWDGYDLVRTLSRIVATR